MSAVTPGVAFVGRDPELGGLAAYLAAEERPPGGVLLISGPAGVGKTRLVDEAVRRATGTTVVRGYCPSNRQIAARLVLSERTVESHVRSILAKTQCANRTEFVAQWNPS